MNRSSPINDLNMFEPSESNKKQNVLKLVEIDILLSYKMPVRTLVDWLWSHGRSYVMLVLCVEHLGMYIWGLRSFQGCVLTLWTDLSA